MEGFYIHGVQNNATMPNGDQVLLHEMPRNFSLIDQTPEGLFLKLEANTSDTTSNNSTSNHLSYRAINNDVLIPTGGNEYIDFNSLVPPSQRVILEEDTKQKLIFLENLCTTFLSTNETADPNLNINPDNNSTANKNNENNLNDVFNDLLKCLLDQNKTVQQTAYTTICQLLHDGDTKLLPYLEDILKVIKEAFSCYKSRNINIILLYDIIKLISRTNLRQELTKPAYESILMPTIMNRWILYVNSPAKDTRRNELISLCDCLSELIFSMENTLKTYGNMIYNNCINFIGQDYSMAKISQMNGVPFTPKKTFNIAMLNLLAHLSAAMDKTVLEHLVHQNKTIELIQECLADDHSEIRQSTLAVLGQMLKNCFHLMRPFSNSIVQVILTNITLKDLSVTNNAIWVLGELCIQLKTEMSPHVPVVMHALIAIIRIEQLPTLLLQNAATTIGYLGYTCTNESYPFMPEFIRHWLEIMRQTITHREKEMALRGICKLVLLNLKRIIPYFSQFCSSIINCKKPSAELFNLVSTIFQTIRINFGQNSWKQLLSVLPPDVGESLRSIYSV